MAQHVQAIESVLAALAVTDLYINESGPLYVRIVGRKPGLFAWLLTKMKLSSTVIFRVYEKHLEYSDDSVSGEFAKTIPFSSINNVESGYLKPFIYLAIAGLCVPLAFFTRGLTLAVVPVLLFSYFFGRTLKMSLIPQSGVKLEFSFRRSVIEWVDLSEADANRIVAIVADRVQQNT